jgi:putative FmdB family regulatory protein
MQEGIMPKYDYKCKECGNVFEFFRRFSELDEQVKCPNCSSGKADMIFSIPHIEGETVAGSGYGKTEFPPNQSRTKQREGRGMGREGQGVEEATERDGKYSEV